MSSHVTIAADTGNELRIELRQSEGEVVLFGVFVLLLIGAVYALMAEARRSPGWLFGLLAVAAAWSAIALSARESYTIAMTAGTIDAVRSSLLGTRRTTLNARDVAAVRLAIGGPDDNRQLVELVADNGKVLIRIPWRLTTLTEANQLALGDAVARCLGVRVAR